MDFCLCDVFVNFVKWTIYNLQELYVVLLVRRLMSEWLHRIYRFSIFVCTLMLASSCAVFGQEDGVSASATTVFSIGNFPVTDSIIATWVVSLFFIFVMRWLLRGGVNIIPSTGQAVIESLIEGLGGIIEGIVGRKAFKFVLPLLLGYFFFIIVHNWSGLFPGIGSIGVYIDGVFRPFLRPANADLNTTLAMALIAFFAWLYYCIKCAGAKALYFEVFGNKAEKTGMAPVMYKMLFVVFFAVGFIECISILCRIISLSFRLFGNTFGGENLLHNMYGFSDVLKNIPVVNYISYFIPLPFYFLEFLIAIIQAFVFTLLVSVYIGLVCNHDEHEQHDEFLQKEKLCGL